jgi:hypothetical protein
MLQKATLATCVFRHLSPSETWLGSQFAFAFLGQYPIPIILPHQAFFQSSSSHHTMVSVLSARLAYSSGYSSSGSDTTLARATTHESVGARGTKRDYASSHGGGSSGYMADLSATLVSTAESALSRSSPSFPPSIELFRGVNRQGKTVSQSGRSSDSFSSTTESDDQTGPSVKRHKAVSKAEMNYMVRNVKQDMEKGGLVYQMHGARRPRVFPPKSFVDMSSVSLVISDSGATTPFSFPYLQEENCSRYIDCPLQLASLIQSTSAHYTPKFNEPLPDAFATAVNKLRQEVAILEDVEKESSSDGDSESTMSSFTLSDGGGGARQSTNSTASLVEANGQDMQTSSSSTPKSAVMPISEALSISRHPRYGPQLLVFVHCQRSSTLKSNLLILTPISSESLLWHRPHSKWYKLMQLFFVWSMRRRLAIFWASHCEKSR